MPTSLIYSRAGCWGHWDTRWEVNADGWLIPRIVWVQVLTAEDMNR